MFFHRFESELGRCEIEIYRDFLKIWNVFDKHLKNFVTDSG